jgi:hypothetical protein
VVCYDSSRQQAIIEAMSAELSFFSFIQMKNEDLKPKLSTYPLEHKSVIKIRRRRILSMSSVWPTLVS